MQEHMQFEIAGLMALVRKWDDRESLRVEANLYHFVLMKRVTWGHPIIYTKQKQASFFLLEQGDSNAMTWILRQTQSFVVEVRYCNSRQKHMTKWTR
jgi:diadenosine tetraphosphate (Ap4A) HIT family hydrolase